MIGWNVSLCHAKNQRNHFWLTVRSADLGRLMAARSNKIKSYYVPKNLIQFNPIYCILGAFNLRLYSLYRFIYLDVQFESFSVWVEIPGKFGLISMKIFRFGVVVSAEKWLVKIQKCTIPKFRNDWELSGNFCPILIRSRILTR